LVPLISTGSQNEEMTYKMKLHVGKKTCLITKAGVTPPIARIITRKGAASLTHSLFGRYSASLSFPLVSPEKKRRVSSCIVQKEEIHEDESNVEPSQTWALGVRSNEEPESFSKP
jgi:hypothetical protein